MQSPSTVVGRRLLVVDDDAELRDSLCELLRSDGYEVAAAANGSEGLLSLHRGPQPDLILLDLVMPVKDGWQFRIEQKGDSSIAMIPVMAMSADDTPKAAAIDADIYIKKPFRYEDLLANVRRVIESKRLRYLDRMASLGTLAAGIAHEINNPLTYVMANLQIAEQTLTQMPVEAKSSARALVGAKDAQPPDVNGFSPSAVAARLRDALEGAERIRNIIADVKTFSRAGDDRQMLIDVRGVMDSAIRVVLAEIRQKAGVVKEYADVPLVMANAGQLGQVFVNLLLNAAYAISEGDPDNNVIRIGIGTSSDLVLVEVSDTGEGIPLDVQNRIFDPFFTTKPVGIGTGLGLSICHGIVQSLGGNISVESDVGRGSVFRITLPRSAQVGGSSFPPPAVAANSVRRGRVLIVDDEPQVAHAVGALLQPDHDVSVAMSGAEALKVLAADSNGRHFDVVLCDLHMTGMSGMDLHEKLVATRPEIAKRMVFMTGGTFTVRSREFVARVKNRCVDKPIDATKLRNLIANRVRASS